MPIYCRGYLSCRYRLYCLVILTLSAAGCGRSKGDLSGKISYQGKSLASGSVLLIGADAKPRTCWIEADGGYHFADVPVGEVKLAVNSPDPARIAKASKKRREEQRKRLEWTAKESLPPEPDAPQSPPGDPTKWLAIPAEYRDIDHSGLRVTIHPGPNTYDIEMK